MVSLQTAPAQILCSSIAVDMIHSNISGRHRGLQLHHRCTHLSSAFGPCRPFSQSRSLRLTPQLRNRLANASFLSAFLFSIFAVSLMSGKAPCPARPGGRAQRSESDSSLREHDNVDEMRKRGRSSQDQAKEQPVTSPILDGHSQKYAGISARLAQLVQGLRRE